MKRFVLDHSVCSTWFLRRRKSQHEILAARDLYNRVRRRRIALIEPPTWYADVATTLLRLQPRHAPKMIDELITVNARIDDDFIVLQRAAFLSVKLGQKLSDTLYHATAIEHDITLVTSNAAYFRKARHLGNIVLLSEWLIEADVGEGAPAFASNGRKKPLHCRRKH